MFVSQVVTIRWMEPIAAVYIKLEYMPEEEEEDCLLVPISDRSRDELQQNTLALCGGKSGANVAEKLRVRTTLLVGSDVSNTSISNVSNSRNKSMVRQAPYTCAICSQYFSTWDLLVRHVFSHNLCINSPLYICQYCGQVFPNLSMFCTHNVQECKKNGSIETLLFELVCAFCADTFLSWCSLTIHVFTHISAVAAPLYVCTYCSEVFEDITKLQLHRYNSIKRGYCIYQKPHTYRCKQQPSVDDLQYNSVEAEPVITYSCINRCNSNRAVEPSTSIELHDHQRNYISGSQFNSDVCDKSFKQSRDLKKQQVIHSADRLLFCDVCGKGFTQSGHLNGHRRIHSGERPFVCEDCGKSFTESGHLKRHRKIHLGERFFSCLICGKSFTQSGNLKRHQTIHSGELPFSCEFCRKSFTQSGDLKRHQSVHSGKRPFPCQVCGKSFTQSGDLKRHQTTHSDERVFTCEVCGKGFTQLRLLKGHHRIHSGDRPFPCKVCGKCFTESGNLKRHQRIH